MSRNVARSLRRACAPARCHSAITQHSIRRWYSDAVETQDTEEIIPEGLVVEDREEALHLLRSLDQKHLSACRRGTDDIIRIVPKARDEIASLPVTVQTIPEIPPYTIGRLKQLTRDAFPEAAKRTVAAAQHVREHLIDLQYQPYKDGDSNSQSQFEREIANLTEEQKWERYNEVKNQAEAQEARLVRKAREVTKKAEETIARHKKLKGKPKEPMPSFGEMSRHDSDVDEQTLKDVADMEIVTEGKGGEGWDTVKREPRAEVVESTGWKDAEEAWVLPIRAVKTDRKDTDKVTEGESQLGKATEVKVRQHRSGSSDADDEQKPKAEAMRSSFEELKGSLESTVPKDKR